MKFRSARRIPNKSTSTTKSFRLKPVDHLCFQPLSRTNNSTPTNAHSRRLDRQPTQLPTMASLFDDADEPELKINPVFAKKYEDRKKREELSNLKDKYGDSESEESESTSEEEDETGQLVTPFLDAQIVKTIASIKRKDPEVYDPKTAFFEEEEVKKAKEAWKEKQKKKEKPVTLKDLQRKRLLEGKLDGEDYEEEGKKLLTMVEEQEKAKRELKVGWIR